MLDDKVLFIGDTSQWSVLASKYLNTTFREVDSVFWDHGDRKPTLVDEWHGDRIFCFKSDLVLDAEVLERVTTSAINFHPAIPAYRGIGGYDYVLRDGGAEFGATSHHMVEKIDAGSIIKVQRFPINAGETAEGLSERTAAYCLMLFYDIVNIIHAEEPLPVSDEHWGPKLYTRAMLRRFKAEQAALAAMPAVRVPDDPALALGLDPRGAMT